MSAPKRRRTSTCVLHDNADIAGSIFAFLSVRDVLRAHALSRNSLQWFRTRFQHGPLLRDFLAAHALTNYAAAAPLEQLKTALALGREFAAQRLPVALPRRRVDLVRSRARGAVVPCSACPSAFAVLPTTAYMRAQCLASGGGYLCAMCATDRRRQLLTKEEVWTHYALDMDERYSVVAYKYLYLPPRRNRKRGTVTWYLGADIERLVAYRSAAPA